MIQSDIKKHDRMLRCCDNTLHVCGDVMQSADVVIYRKCRLGENLENPSLSLPLSLSSPSLPRVQMSSWSPCAAPRCLSNSRSCGQPPATPRRCRRQAGERSAFPRSPARHVSRSLQQLEVCELSERAVHAATKKKTKQTDFLSRLVTFLALLLFLIFLFCLFY